MVKIKNKFMNTYPVIFHHNGRPSLFRNSSAYTLKGKVFEYFSKGEDNGFFRGRKEKLNYCIPKKKKICDPVFNDLTVVMISNLEEYGSAARSLEYYGIPYTVVGKEISVFDGWEKFKKIIEKKYKKVYHDDKYLKYISNNALMWFKNNILYPSVPNLIQKILKDKFNYEL